MRPVLRLAALAGLVLSSSTLACSSAGDGEDAAADQAEVVQNGAPALCAAVRGNGENIVAHFTSLARIVEHYGPVDALAGGSSASITQFLYESIVKNPAIYRGTREEKAKRVALALKSIQGYGTVVAGSEEAAAIGDLVAAAGRLKAEVESRGIGTLVSSDAALAAQKLRDVLSIPELKTLVNPEVVAMLGDAEHLSFNVQEIYAGISTLGAFSVDDNRLFFRPGILAWQSLAELFGRVADFYAGYGPSDEAKLGAWLDDCADEAVGKTWDDLAGSSCETRFGELVTSYRDAVRGGEGRGRSRRDDLVGAPGPVHKLVATSVLEGDAVPAYEAARRAYLSGAHPTGNIPFDVRFSDVKFGYWGSDADLDALTDAAAKARDLKSKKITTLGNKPWREALTASPAEPGLSRFVELPDGRISAGGWSDLAPVLVLQAIGCESVVYVTREGDESQFATKIAKHLGMQKGEYDALYDLAKQDSSYSLSVTAADGVWCTNWNAFTPAQQREMARDAYFAPLETRAGLASVPVIAPYENAVSRAGKPGCTPGLSAGATYPR